jgi:stage II sporulation protein D
MPFRATVLIVVLAAALAGCVSTEPDVPRPAALTAPTVIRVGTQHGIVSVPLEDYVLGSVLAEVSPVTDTPDVVNRIFDVQAILARTYALAHLGRHKDAGFDVCDETHCQRYDPARIGVSRFSDAARAAVLRTRGLVIAYGGRPIDALFHSDSGGHTAAAQDVWGGAPVPYLVGMVDEVPGLTPHAWQLDIPAAGARAAFNADARSAVGRRLDRLTVVARDASGRAERLEISGDQSRSLRGEEFRSILNRAFGDRAVQSTRFTVRPTSAGYHFDGTGFGHGVGLGQSGAAARARRGDSARAILAVYFPGTTVTAVRATPQPTPALQAFPRLLQ